MTDRTTTDRTTYVLVDGENIDATLGQSILGRRPQPHERPRWDRLLQFAEDHWDQQTKGLFFLAANGELPMPFVQALTSMGFRPVPLSGRTDEKVVDIAIQRTLDELARREADVMLASNDGDFIEQLSPLVGDGRRTALLAFHEFRSSGYIPLFDRGLEFHDLEYDVRAFNDKLPRIRVIPIAEFDPNEFL
jgi:uncharacterized protein